MKELYRCFCLFIVIWMMVITTAQAQKILVNNAWVRGVPPSAKTTAAYMTIENTGAEDIVLKSVSCEKAEVVQIHNMGQVGETMMMKEVSELRIPAGEKAVLASKGYHIMLIGLLQPIAESEIIPLSLNFAGGTTVNVDAVVRKWGPMAPMSHN